MTSTSCPLLHILNVVPGAALYDDVRRRALVVELDGVQLAIAGLDLIAMKRASGRLCDREDLAVLTAIPPT